MIEKKSYPVCVDRIKTVNESCTITVEATSWDDAIQQVEDAYYEGHLENELVEVEYDTKEVNFYRG